MFNSYSGSFTVYDSEGITLASALSVSTDELKGYRIAITIASTTTEYEITGNTTTIIYFENSIAAGGTFAIDFVTRELLESFESDMSSVIKISDAMLTSKIGNAKKFFFEKLKSQFRYLYDEFPDEDSPLERLINLGEIQTAFCYYLISELYSDLLLTEGDINQYKAKLYMSRYKEVVSDALARLAYLREGTTELDNTDLGSSQNKGVLMSR